MSNLTRTADYLSDSLEALGFVIMSKKSGEGLPLVAFRLPPKEDRNYDEFALAHQLRVRGWVVPAYTMAPNTNGLKMLRVVVREDFSRARCDQLICDIRQGQCLLEDMDKESIRKQQEFIQKHHTASGKASHNHPKFKVRPATSPRPLPPPICTCLLLTRAVFAEGEALHPGKVWQDARYLLTPDVVRQRLAMFSRLVNYSTDGPSGILAERSLCGGTVYCVRRCVSFSSRTASRHSAEQKWKLPSCCR